MNIDGWNAIIFFIPKEKENDFMTNKINTPKGNSNTGSSKGNRAGSTGGLKTIRESAVHKPVPGPGGKQ